MSQVLCRQLVRRSDFPGVCEIVTGILFRSRALGEASAAEEDQLMARCGGRVSCGKSFALRNDVEVEIARGIGVGKDAVDSGSAREDDVKLEDDGMEEDAIGTICF